MSRSIRELDELQSDSASAMTSRRTVLHLINTAGPGGAETVFANLARGLDRDRWRSIAVISDHGTLYDELRASNIETIVTNDRGASALPRYLLTLLRLMSVYDVKLVHGHLFGPGYVASLLGLLRGVPSIATIHGLPDLARNERFYRTKVALLGHTRRLVFVSESLRKAVLEERLIRPERTTVIVNGVDFSATESACPEAVRADLLNGGEFVVGAVGNLRRPKAYEVFLDAASMLAQRFDGYRFVIAGQGVNTTLGRSLVARRDALGLEKHVRFLGYRPDARVVLRALDVYALTSSTEGFSLATVEAMGLGVPVVATRCGGPEEIVEAGVTGLLVANGSAEAVADGIEYLRLHPGERERMTRAGQASAVGRYSLNEQVLAYEKLYEDVLARG